jgi:hypothetical protein
VDDEYSVAGFFVLTEWGEFGRVWGEKVQRRCGFYGFYWEVIYFIAGGQKNVSQADITNWSVCGFGGWLVGVCSGDYRG